MGKGVLSTVFKPEILRESWSHEEKNLPIEPETDAALRAFETFKESLFQELVGEEGQIFSSLLAELSSELAQAQRDAESIAVLLDQIEDLMDAVILTRE